MSRHSDVVAGFAPDAVTVGSRHLEVDGDWVATFAVAGFPREVYPGWLQARRRRSSAAVRARQPGAAPG